MPHASSGWSRLAWATMASYVARSMVNTGPAYLPPRRGPVRPTMQDTSGSGREACRDLVGQGRLDAFGQERRHLGERVQGPPAHVDVLVVGHARLAGEPGAGEGEVEVDPEVAVRVGDLRTDTDRREPVHRDVDTGLLERLAPGGHPGLLARVDDAGHGGPLPVVGTPGEQHLVVAADDRGDGRQPQLAGADELAE